MSHQQDKPNPDSREHRELEELRRRWAASEQTEPPDMLDQAVLNAARRALDREAKRTGRRWLGALATAAVVVLAVTVVIRQGPREPQPPAASSREERQLKLQRPAAQTVEEPSAEAPSSRRETDSVATAEDEDSNSQRLSARPTAVAPAPSSMPATEARARMADEAPAEEAPKNAIDREAADKARLLPPDEWIRRLLALKAQGDTDSLTVELAAFVRAYPDYELPAELKPRSP